MDQFIQRENIHRYQQLLERVTDENQRQLLLKITVRVTQMPVFMTGMERIAAVKAAKPMSGVVDLT
jgi:hypothetical protein